MRITDSAVPTIVNLMRSRGLDLKTYLLEFGVFEGTAPGIAFTAEPKGQIFQFGDLRVSISPQVDTDRLVVDYGEVAGRKGIIFLEDTNV